MSFFWFNRNPVQLGDKVNADFSQIESTPNLRRASLSNAALFGGPVLRQCLESAPIVGDRKHILVDTKVSMLMPGWWPAIPGWHTDGVPRFKDGVADDKGRPSLRVQESMSLTHPDDAPRYHTVHIGNDCPTVFLGRVEYLEIEHDTDEQMYSEMTRRVDAVNMLAVAAPMGTWMSWDWWNIHQASQAVDRGWRLLIRITESDMPPATEDFIRTQNQVYVPREFGW